MRKDEITVRGNWHESLPALNVKVYFDESDVTWETLADDFGWDAAELDRFRAWLREQCDAWEYQSMTDWAWDEACRDGFELAGTDLEDVFSDYNLTIEQDGRSGGWLVVRGLPDVESWDAIMVAKWGKFAKWVEAIRVDTSYRFAWLLAANVWEREEEETERAVLDAVL